VRARLRGALDLVRLGARLRARGGACLSPRRPKD
jgi:hypothetical protein